MKPTPAVWGIDLGQCALKALRLQEVDGQLQATAFDYVEYPKILSQPDADPDQLIREALEQFLSRNNVRGEPVAISVPGQSGLARFVKLPPVEEKKIADIVKFEAKQQIPFNLDEVVWDYQKLGSGTVVDGFALDTEVGLFAMKRDMVNRYLQHFRDVGVEVYVIQMAPLALCNYVAYDLLSKGPNDPPTEGAKNCVVALDIGADSSNLVITDGGKIIWQRPIPLGGNHFTRALTKDMKLTFAKAEHLKRNATKSGATELKKILTSLKPVLTDFVGEVQRSLGYFTNTHRDAQIEYMVGLGNAFRLPGLQRFLAEKLQLDVRKAEKMNRLTGDVLAASIYTENVLSFGVAYGLALQAMQQAKLVTNLLPVEIRTERLIKAKKPWAVAAAALLAVSLGAAALGSGLDMQPYTAKTVKDAMGQSKSAADKAKQMENAFNTAKANALKEEEAVKSIVAGQPERLNWLHLMKFISDTVPQPNAGELYGKPGSLPGKMGDTTFGQYWKNIQKSGRTPGGPDPLSGEDAYKEYQKRLASGATQGGTKKADATSLPEGTDDLIQFHIHAVDCRWCEDLKGFWAAATKGKEEGDVRPREDYKKAPEGKGWVVEVVGYTYHYGKDNFVRDTLLASIAERAAKPKTPSKDGDKKPMDGMNPTPKGGNQPKPTTPTTGQPATAAAADQKDDIDSTKEPVLDRVSHVVLYNTISSPYAGGGSLEIITTSTLDTLVKTAAPATTPGAGDGKGGAVAPPTPGGAPAPEGATPGGKSPLGGSGRDTWTPLSSRAGGGTGGVTGIGRGGDFRPPTPMPPKVGGGDPIKQPGNTTQPAKHTRTEFIILFVWREPVPSDGLRGDEAAPAAGGGATAPPTTGGTTPQQR